MSVEEAIAAACACTAAKPATQSRKSGRLAPRRAGDGSGSEAEGEGCRAGSGCWRESDGSAAAAEARASRC